MTEIDLLPRAATGDTNNTGNEPSTPPPDRTEEPTERPTAPRPWPTQDEQTGRVFGLLIAVDHYDSPGANLSGCVHDSLAVEQYLRESVDRPGERLHLMKLRSPLPSRRPEDLVLDAPEPASAAEGQPTREAVVDAFLNFLTQAKKGDTVFVHFSGHGSFEQLPPKLHHLGEQESNYRAETLVLRDSFTKVDGVYRPPLRDKELRWLIGRVAQLEPHILFCMDCCNAAGNTRLKEENVQVRFMPPNLTEEEKGVAFYAFYQRDPQARALLDEDPARFELPEGRHVALYAGHSYQLAKEADFDEGRFGVFTYYLLQTLRASRGNISYRDLTKLLRAKAGKVVANQSPQRHATVPKDSDLLFLGGTTVAHTDAFTVRPTDAPDRAMLDAGSLHGLVDPAQGKTWLRVFSPSVPAWQASPNEGLRAYIDKMGPQSSELVFADGGQYPADEPFQKAIITAEPVTKVRVSVETEINEQPVVISDTGNDPTLQRLAEARNRLISALQDHPQLELVATDAPHIQYTLYAYVHQGLEKLRIAAKDEVAAIVEAQVGFGDSAVDKLLEDMAHIARWERTLHLSKDQYTVIQPGDVVIEAIDSQGQVVEDNNGEIVLEVRPNQPLPQLKFRVSLKNRDQGILYVALLHLTSKFGVNPSLLADDAHLGRENYLEDSARIKFEQYEVYAGSHVPINGVTNPQGLYLAFSLPQPAGDIVYTECKDHFKLIVSTEQFDPMHLWQKDLRAPANTRAGRRPQQVHNQLEAMMQSTHSRNAAWAVPAGAAGTVSQKLSDWYATTLTVKTMKGG
ncbi:MAG: caspase family protein [Lewinella sp.]|nr:caspase family protein [Lewinella sp.]